MIEDKTGYPKAVFFVVASILLVTLMILIGGTKLMVDLVGFVYPAYMSFKSMDSGNQDVTQWLTYWVVFSFSSILENVFGFFIQMIPFYTWIKVCIIVWMYHPSSMGAKTVYEQGLRPLLLPYIEVTEPKKGE